MHYKTAVQLVDKNTYRHKAGLEKYCSVKSSHTGVNNTWILKNSTNLLSSQVTWESLKQLSFKHLIFLLYTSIPHDLLKPRMNNIINNAFNPIQAGGGGGGGGTVLKRFAVG